MIFWRFTIPTLFPNSPYFISKSKAEAKLPEGRRRMSENKAISRDLDMDAKYDACMDLTIRRVFYSTLGSGFAGLLLLRTPVGRRAAFAFGTGLGLGTAYTECAQILNAHPTKVSTFETVNAHPTKVSSSETVNDIASSEE